MMQPSDPEMQAGKGAGADPATIDAIFRALSDPTRRDVLARLSLGPAPVSDLAAAHAMALPSFLSHLKVLEQSGLVRSRKTGRVRMVALEADQLRRAESWLEAQRRLWEQRLDQLDAYLVTMTEEEAS